VSVVDVNPSNVPLEWTASTDDGPYLFYQGFVDGNQAGSADTEPPPAPGNRTGPASVTLVLDLCR
jgi:hypothetical protein